MVLKEEVDNKISRPPRRFACYNKPVIQSKEEWNERCHLKMITCLYSHAVHSTRKSKKDKVIAYKELLLRLKKNFAPQVGTLIMGHSMAIMSQIGLLPAWIRDHVRVEVESRYIQHFRSRFSLDEELFCLGCNRFMKVVQGALVSRFGTPFSIRKVENILCKVYRIDQGGDTLW
jgi:hypothetical protein